MWRSNKYHIENEKLDRFGEELLHALESSDAEISSAATSPFLYRRIRVRIEAEERRRVEERNRWFALLVEAKHAIPVLVLIALVAAGLVWYAPLRTSLPSTTNNNLQSTSQIIIGDELPSLSGDELIASVVGFNEVNSDQLKEQ